MVDNTIEIIIPSSNEYVPYTAALLASILYNTNKDYNISFHIITEDINEESVRKISILQSIRNFKIEYKYISENDVSYLPMPVTSHITSKIVYSKLKISSLFPEIDKAIILESDMIVTGDVAKLWNLEFEQNYICAVPDLWYQYRNLDINLPSDFKYYVNTGMFLANLKMWRNKNVESLFSEIIAKADFELKFPDQDIINSSFKGKIKYLPMEWNAQISMFENSNFLSKDERDNIFKNAEIIHYLCALKPWLAPEYYFSDVFWRYATKTPFYEEILSRYIDYKIKNVSYKAKKKAYKKSKLKKIYYYIKYKFSFGEAKQHYKRKYNKNK